MAPKKLKCRGCKNNLSAAAVEEKREFCTTCIEKDTCIRCNTMCKDTDKALQCDMCKDWFHIKCVGVPDKTYEMIRDSNELKCGVRYFCPVCDPKAMDMVQSFSTMKLRQDGFERELEKMKEKLIEMCEMKDVTFATKIKNTAREESYDVSERQQKALNLVISALPEIDDTSDEAKADKERLGLTDCTTEQEIFNKVMENIDGLDAENVEVEECSRIPTRRREDGPPRYMLVKLKCPTAKRMILEKSGKTFRKRDLQTGVFTHAYKNVYINNDLTKEERLKQYELRMEKRRRTEAGEKDLIIRNGEIIQRPQTNRTPGAHAPAGTDRNRGAAAAAGDGPHQ